MNEEKLEKIKMKVIRGFWSILFIIFTTKIVLLLFLLLIGIIKGIWIIFKKFL
jgi:hypothetical protein